jgi:ERCC4-type nuclease
VNDHITNVLDKQGLKYISKKLKYGDYSFIVEEIPELNIPYIDFSNKIAIERKAHLDELSNNLTNKRKQFIEELQRAYYDRAKLTLLIENNTYEDILRHNYMSRFESKSFIASLITFKHKYDTDFIFINSLASANFIYNTMKYYLRNYLKGM